MRLLPLILSAQTSDGGHPFEVGSAQRSGGPHSCQFCGCDAAVWQERFSCDDAKDGDRGGDAVACPLCYLVRHLERVSIDREAILIWLPEFSQASINALTRGAHRRFAAHQMPPDIDHAVSGGDKDVVGARNALLALRARSLAAFERLGTNSPRDLGRALLALPPETYKARGRLLAGLRLLPLGRFFEGDADVYSTLLDEASAQSAAKEV